MSSSTATSPCTDIAYICNECTGGCFYPPAEESPSKCPCGSGWACTDCRKACFCPDTSIALPTYQSIPLQGTRPVSVLASTTKDSRVPLSTHIINVINKSTWSPSLGTTRTARPSLMEDEARCSAPGVGIIPNNCSSISRAMLNSDGSTNHSWSSNKTVAPSILTSANQSKVSISTTSLSTFRLWPAFTPNIPRSFPSTLGHPYLSKRGSAPTPTEGHFSIVLDEISSIRVASGAQRNIPLAIMHLFWEIASKLIARLVQVLGPFLP